MNNTERYKYFNRDGEGRDIIYCKCDNCNSEKGQWLDETPDCGDGDGIIVHAVLCSKCADKYIRNNEI